MSSEESDIENSENSLTDKSCLDDDIGKMQFESSSSEEEEEEEVTDNELDSQV